MGLDQFSSVLGSMQNNTAVSEKQVDNKRSERSNFSSLSFFTIRFLSLESLGFSFGVLRSSRVLRSSCFDPSFSMVLSSWLSTS